MLCEAPVVVTLYSVHHLDRFFAAHGSVVVRGQNMRDVVYSRVMPSQALRVEGILLTSASSDSATVTMPAFKSNLWKHLSSGGAWAE
jgi:hypothetical protein